MRTAKPVVLREEANFDVTLPLRDASGKIIGAIGLTFKPRGGEQESRALARAKAMAREVEKHITSEATLFEPVG